MRNYGSYYMNFCQFLHRDIFFFSIFHACSPVSMNLVWFPQTGKLLLQARPKLQYQTITLQRCCTEVISRQHNTVYTNAHCMHRLQYFLAIQHATSVCTCYSTCVVCTYPKFCNPSSFQIYHPIPKKKCCMRKISSCALYQFPT